MKQTNRQRDVKLYETRHGLYTCKFPRTKAIVTPHNIADFRSHAERQANKRIKGKAIPLEAWTGPEGSRSLRFPDFKTIST